MIGAQLLRDLRRHEAAPIDVAVGEELAALRDIEVSFDREHILRGVDLSAHAGELVALVGPNGAGKSTMLAVLAGDVTPDAGEVWFGGKPLSSMPEIEVARRRAVLPQKSTVTFPFTVRQVVQMGRSPWAQTDRVEDDESVVDEAMRATGVDALFDRAVSALSGGEAARVALARVLAQQTQLLLLDEPTAALDIHHQEQCMSVVRARVDNGAGAVVVLHDLGAAAAHADRVVIIDAGRVAADGTPREVLTPELLTRIYRHPVDVLPHPLTGEALVLPRRSTSAPQNGSGPPAS